MELYKVKKKSGDLSASTRKITNINVTKLSTDRSVKDLVTFPGNVNLLQPSVLFYVPPGLIFKISTRFSLCVECFVRISEKTATFAV
jgi:hypothetical protein